MRVMPKKADQIFIALRDRIVYLEYLPGALLSEKELCEEFKVSRTPLREAIRKLEDMGLVKSIPRFGTYVTAIDINEIRCAFEVKKKLEALAGALAARRISKDKLEELRSITEQVEAYPEGGRQSQADRARCPFPRGHLRGHPKFDPQGVPGEPAQPLCQAVGL